jgi:predicted nucleic acid-binding Zn ribbon protein
MGKLLYTEQDLERFRALADECDYELKTIARRLGMDIKTAQYLSSRRNAFAPLGQRLWDLMVARKRQRQREAIIRNHGNLKAAAAELFISPKSLHSYNHRIGMTLEERREISPPRRCSICGHNFRTTSSNRKVCSTECRRVMTNRSNMRKYRQRMRQAGREVEPVDRDYLELQVKHALWQTFGRVYLVAKMLNKGESAIWRAIKNWGLWDYYQKCRASIYDHERLLEILEAANYDMRAAERSQGWFRGKITRLCKIAGASHLVRIAVCKHCGKHADRPAGGGHKDYCSPTCRDAARKQRIKQAAKEKSCSRKSL